LWLCAYDTAEEADRLMTKLQDKSEFLRLIPFFLGFEELELPTTANPDLSSGLKRE
jgi:hypothetical protein